MNGLLINLLLAFAWAAMTGSFGLGTLATGAALGFFALWLSAPLTGIDRLYFLRTYRVVRLALFFFWELLLSSLRVAWDVIRPFPKNKPAIIEVPLTVQSDIEILLVTNLISLTPGTLSVDVTQDRSTLLVHAMFADDPDALVAELKNGMERMVAEVFEK
ncbi:Na+/H+ antiporter subunit E [Roseinatronobacter alkalisoli]|uniref:Na+/H+ antiporter subunit E n=1 Tax=Roseinatronobacter alkalisoli TaxID=3028235 RepID=A0ABT5T8P8_9RHOB|nr:Na+/H+ antiporter subunit E [Roseinatronobacter sp. HJB301]MDD7971454.1 Na+/H+ antiporter subunit E [Roseinatronobacter sp. HJB301]